MRTYRLFQVDAFTREKYAGNPAGVVLDAEGLGEEDMRRVARELNNSETAFVFPSRSPEYDVHVRFFTPTREVPICGHATVAAHYVLAKTRGMAGGRVLQKTGAGILPVDILADGDDLRIVMTQGGIEFGREILGEERARLLSALHLRESDLRAGYPVQIVSTGHSKVMVPINSRSLLDARSPDSAALAALSRDIGCNGYYVFTADWSGDPLPVHGRCLPPRRASWKTPSPAMPTARWARTWCATAWCGTMAASFRSMLFRGRPWAAPASSALRWISGMMSPPWSGYPAMP